MTNALTPRSFSYEQLPEVAATALKDSAERIRALVKRSVSNIVDTGRELIAAKRKLEHGQFGGWLEVEFGMTVRTAQNYMRAAEWAADKCETISLLEPTSVYLLSSASTPEPVQLAVIERIQRGERVPLETIRRMARDAKEADSLAKVVGKKHKRLSKADRQAAAEAAQRRQEAQQRRAAIASGKVIAALKAKLTRDELIALLKLWREHGVHLVLDALEEIAKGGPS